MGPERAADSLRKALAIGADRAVHVSDEGLAGSDLVATSKALAKALEREGADIVLFGQQAGDSDGAVLWAAVADRLRLPVISQAASLEASDGKVKVKRQTEYGYDVIEAPSRAWSPCPTRSTSRATRPSRGSWARRRSRRRPCRSPISGLRADDAGEPGSRTEVYGLSDPPSRGESERIEDDGPAAAEKIVDYLSSHKLI